ncbi:MAG TPA: hypothetical protein VGC77_13880 [Rhodopseudomonas sp.]|uniref:hypothetical protein n=1 Tax=Rhodopseudomonas sp. TaxID=1078 RepID=UPI002ED9C3E3
MQDMAKWILRAVIVVFGAGFVYVYVSRNGWTLAEMPTVWDANAPAASGSPATAPVAPRAPALPSAAAATPAASAPSAAATSFPPCQPIGRTEKGELVYSMDCKRLPQP